MSLRALTAASLMLFAVVTSAQQPQAAKDEATKVLQSIRWVNGPGKGEMKDIAAIDVPAGYIFAKAEDVAKLMELMENPVSGQEVGFLAPEDMSWFMVFEFDEVGYVKDDERDKLDADAILKNIKDGTEAANEERKKRGWDSLNIVGWEQQPKYDPSSNNLTWAIRGESGGSQIVNFNTRILGREGVMEVALVVDPPQLAGVLPTSQKLLGDYAFVPGKRYAEFKQGDKLAAYGLAALITGGTVAAAAKSGLLAKLLKVLAKFGIFIAAGAAALFKKLFGKKDENAA
ncbi:MAG TPA: DUF2167 domain-containing protein [Thermoanaerobaculia bacterium]|jgi:uncharacterized membrane-anchored protein|nr:DUF2167 domain-containing protein [Thermoanaerobaculia bacterium]